MSLEINLFGRTLHIGGKGQPSKHEEPSEGQTKSGRKVSSLSGAQPQTPSGNESQATSRTISERKPSYIDGSEPLSSRQFKKAQKKAAKELGDAVRKGADSGALQAILEKKTLSVSSLDTLLTKLPKKAKGNENLNLAVRQHTLELLKKEASQPVSNSAWSSKLATLKADTAEVTGSKASDLKVSLNDSLKGFPEVESRLLGGGSGHSERSLKGAKTISIQGLLNFTTAQQMKQQLEENSALDPARAEHLRAELTKIMHDLAEAVKESETKHIPQYGGGSGVLPSGELEALQDKVSQKSVYASKNVVEASPGAKRRPAPVIPSKSVVAEMAKAMSQKRTDLADGLKKVEAYFRGLQAQGVKEEHLQAMINEYPNYADSGWSDQHFNRLSEHVAEALLNGTAQNVTDAFIVGDKAYRSTFPPE